MAKEIPFLVYYELHVADRTFYIHKVVRAKTLEEAFSKMGSTQRFEGCTLQPKGVLGRFTEDLCLRYLVQE